MIETQLRQTETALSFHENKKGGLIGRVMRWSSDGKSITLGKERNPAISGDPSNSSVIKFFFFSSLHSSAYKICSLLQKNVSLHPFSGGTWYFGFLVLFSVTFMSTNPWFGPWIFLKSYFLPVYRWPLQPFILSLLAVPWTYQTCYHCKSSSGILHLKIAIVIANYRVIIVFGYGSVDFTCKLILSVKPLRKILFLSLLYRWRKLIHGKVSYSMSHSESIAQPNSSPRNLASGSLHFHSLISFRILLKAHLKDLTTLSNIVPLVFSLFYVLFSSKHFISTWHYIMYLLVVTCIHHYHMSSMRTAAWSVCLTTWHIETFQYWLDKLNYWIIMCLVCAKHYPRYLKCIKDPWFCGIHIRWGFRGRKQIIIIM